MRKRKQIPKHFEQKSPERVLDFKKIFLVVFVAIIFLIWVLVMAPGSGALGFIGLIVTVAGVYALVQEMRSK